MLKLKNKVIPVSEPDDVLIANPVSVDEIDYRNGELILYLSPSINGLWEISFKNLGSFTYINGFEPNRFEFSTDKARISVPPDENLIRTVVGNFRGYVSQTNEAYKERVLQALKKQQREEQERLQREIEEEEKRQRILKMIR